MELSQELDEIEDLEFADGDCEDNDIDEERPLMTPLSSQRLMKSIALSHREDQYGDAPKTPAAAFGSERMSFRQ